MTVTSKCVKSGYTLILGYLLVGSPFSDPPFGGPWQESECKRDSSRTDPISVKKSRRASLRIGRERERNNLRTSAARVGPVQSWRKHNREANLGVGREHERHDLRQEPEDKRDSSRIDPILAETPKNKKEYWVRARMQKTRPAPGTWGQAHDSNRTNPMIQSEQTKQTRELAKMLRIDWYFNIVIKKRTRKQNDNANNGWTCVAMCCQRWTKTQRNNMADVYFTVDINSLWKTREIVKMLRSCFSISMLKRNTSSFASSPVVHFDAERKAAIALQVGLGNAKGVGVKGVLTFCAQIQIR